MMSAARFSRALPRAGTSAARWAAPMRKPLGSNFARYESTEGKVTGSVIGIDLGMPSLRTFDTRRAANSRY